MQYEKGLNGYITDFEGGEMGSWTKGCGQPLKSWGAMKINILYLFTLSCNRNESIFNSKIFQLVIWPQNFEIVGPDLYFWFDTAAMFLGMNYFDFHTTELFFSSFLIKDLV